MRDSRDDGQIQVADELQALRAVNVKCAVPPRACTPRRGTCVLPQSKRALPRPGCQMKSHEGARLCLERRASGILRGSEPAAAWQQELSLGKPSLAPAALAIARLRVAAYHGRNISIGRYAHGQERRKEHGALRLVIWSPARRESAIGKHVAGSAPGAPAKPCTWQVAQSSGGGVTEIFGWRTAIPGPRSSSGHCRKPTARGCSNRSRPPSRSAEQAGGRGGRTRRVPRASRMARAMSKRDAASARDLSTWPVAEDARRLVHDRYAITRARRSYRTGVILRVVLPACSRQEKDAWLGGMERRSPREALSATRSTGSRSWPLYDGDRIRARYRPVMTDRGRTTPRFAHLEKPLPRHARTATLIHDERRATCSRPATEAEIIFSRRVTPHTPHPDGVLLRPRTVGGPDCRCGDRVTTNEQASWWGA